MSVSAKLENYLHERSVDYVTIPHSALSDSHELVKRERLITSNIARAVIVNIDGQYAMVVCNNMEKIDFDRMKNLLGAKTIRFVTEKECEKLFPDCEKGAIPILGNLFDMQVYCSMIFLNQKKVFFKAGTQEETIRLSIDDFIRLAKPIVGSFTKELDSTLW